MLAEKHEDSGLCHAMAKRLRSLASMLWDSDVEESTVELKEAELRRENWQLKERVQQLEAEVDLLKDQLTRLGRLQENGDHHLCDWPHASEEWMESLRPDVVCLSRLYSEILVELRETNHCEGQIHFEMPQNPKATASHIAKKAEASVTKLWSKHPAVFKIGLTSNPVRRWQHSVYGYCRDRREKWQGMNILFVTPNSLPAALIEAMLISRFKGSPGCRNENPGGETASPGDGPHFVYVVYRVLFSPPRVSGPGHS